MIIKFTLVMLMATLAPEMLSGDTGLDEGTRESLPGWGLVVEKGAGWYQSPTYGNFHVPGVGQWNWHTEHGWVSIKEASTGGVVLYTQSSSSFWWTRADLYPLMFKLNGDPGWYFFYTAKGSPGKCLFFSFNEGRNVSEENLGGKDLEKGLVGYWPLDGDALDLSGNGNDGTVVGARTVNGVKGSGMDFNGLLDHIKVPGKNLIPLGNGSLSYWINPRGNLSDDGLPVSSAGWSNWGSTRHHFHLFEDGRLRGFDYSGADFYSTTTVEDWGDLNDWHHVVYTWSADGKVHVYLDGKEQALTGSVQPLTATSTGIMFGNNVYGVTHNKTGNGILAGLDEIRIYNRAINPAEVLALFEDKENQEEEAEMVSLMVDGREYAVTLAHYEISAAGEAAIQADLGSEWTIADWDELKQVFGATEEDAEKLAALIGEWDQGAGCKRGGSYNYSSWRYYFAAAHYGSLPTSYTFLVHDHMRSNQVSLGSWTGNQRPMIIVRDVGGTFQVTSFEEDTAGQYPLGWKVNSAWPWSEPYNNVVASHASTGSHSLIVTNNGYNVTGSYLPDTYDPEMVVVLFDLYIPSSQSVGRAPTYFFYGGAQVVARIEEATDRFYLHPSAPAGQDDPASYVTEMTFDTWHTFALELEPENSRFRVGHPDSGTWGAWLDYDPEENGGFRSDISVMSNHRQGNGHVDVEAYYDNIRLSREGGPSI